MPPYEATKPSNAMDVETHVELQASFTRTYPELEIGSNVQSYKQKTLGQQERESRFSQHVFTKHTITEQHGQK